MHSRLPPLKALRAFEAAARSCSFTRAAEALNVTQTAVSHQVKVLEDWIGFRLFRRLNNALVLTEKGELHLPTVREAFDRLRERTERLKGLDAGAAFSAVVGYWVGSSAGSAQKTSLVEVLASRQ